MRELALAGVVLAAAPIALLLLAPPWAEARAARRTLAWRNRLATAGLVLSFALVSRGLFPDADERAQFAYICVLTLGYGHLIGAAVFSWRRIAQMAPTGVTPALWGSFWAVSSFTLLALYVWGSGLFVPLALPLLAISAWHTVENDLVLERTYGDRLRLGPIPRALEHHLASLV